MITVTVDHDRNRAFADESENQPLANYCSAIWGINGYMMTMGEAEDLLRWMEPKWCEFKGIGSSGFFHEDMSYKRTKNEYSTFCKNQSERLGGLPYSFVPCLNIALISLAKTLTKEFICAFTFGIIEA